MESESLDFLLNSESLWQFKTEIYKYCKNLKSKDQHQSPLLDIVKDIQSIKTSSIYELSKGLFQHLIVRPDDIKEIATSMRRFLPEVVMISLDSNVIELTAGDQHRIINLHRILSVLLGLYTSIKDKVYLFFRKQKDQYNYSPLAHFQDLIKGSESPEVLNQIFESLIRFMFFDFRLFKEIWGLKLDFDIKVLAGLDSNILFGYITLAKNMLGLSTDQTYSLFETLFNVTSETQEFYELMKRFDEYGQRIYNEVIELRSSFVSVRKDSDSDLSDEDDMEELLQGNLKKVNSGDKNIFVGNNLVVLEPQKRVLQSLWQKLTLNDFIIINGVSGTGKSSYLSILQKKMNKNSITLFMDAQTDFKSMLGNYTCSEKIGEFEWKKGPLASAMENGLWLILENFQEANEELINSLTTCIQSGQVRLQSVGQTVHSSIGFKVIAVTDVKFGRHDHNISASLINLYETAAIVDLNETFQAKECSEVFHYVFKKYSKNENDELVYQQFIKIYESLLCDQGLSDLLNHQQKKALNLNLRSFSALLTRFWHQIKNIYGETGLNSSSYTTENFRKYLFLEVLDCIFYKVKNIREYDFILTKIADILQLSFEELMTFVENYSPDIELKGSRIKLGRLGLLPLDIFVEKSQTVEPPKPNTGLIYNGYTKRIIERIAGCLIQDESCLLIGDTGCGKTTIAQHVAEIFGKKLHVYNLSQGSDAIDLVGGYKPVDMKTLIRKILQKYMKNLTRIASEKANQKFIENLQTLFANKDFAKLLLCMIESFKMLKQKINTKFQGAEKEKLTKKWEKLETRVTNIYRNKDKIDTNLVFDFMEGNLIKAIKEGDWILVDEINLANNELLQKLLPIIEGNSIILFEKGDLKEIKRNKNFRLIACMNPGTDIGKKELPENIRVKFTEFFINDLEDRSDLLFLIEKVLSAAFPHDVKEKLVDFYLWLRRSSDNYELEDGYNKRPHFSLRNISRAMSYMNRTVQLYGVLRAVFEGIFIGFGSVLSTKSQETVQNQVEKMFGFSKTAYMKAVQQINKSMPGYLNIFGFYVKEGTFPIKKPEETDFEVTPTFEKYLIEVMRIVANTKYAVLLEGPTSSGKTSIIKFIAEITGNKCVRVNNHHHTDIEEYIGTYMPNSKGKLVFQEGILVEAVKKGYWIILDELNLARSEILESLNRLLDDNAELFIPEQQMHIKPHENFRLFATQNPIHYSGRKELSKAFKNRFIQIYFDEISESDLEKIILKRCKIAPSFCKKLLGVMKELQLRRQTNNFFMGKEAAITVRDLIKWAKRPIVTAEQLAVEGYCILAERLRTDEDRAEVRKIIEKSFKCKIEPSKYYQEYTESPEFVESRRQLDEFLANKSNYSGISTVQWNASFRRMATLVDKCLRSKEPVLLIGETGCGKTTICQLMSILYNVPFYSINCHHYTESMDFLGSLRPLRNREEIQILLDTRRNALIQHLGQSSTPESLNILQLVQKEMPTDAKIFKLSTILDGLQGKEPLTHQLLRDFLAALGKNESLFEWQDGPLTQAMRNGGIFLIDEISLADDSVLERMNSVLESERTLTLSEKTDEVDMIVANDSFFILATMNPGGDFGKRELSPALRNRFTEVWVEPITAHHYLNYHYVEILREVSEHRTPYAEIFAHFGNDCLNMLAENIEKNRHLTVEFEEEGTVVPMLEVKYELAYMVFRFIHYFNHEFCEKYLNEKKYLSLRDVLTLISFMEKRFGHPVKHAYYDGLAVMILDSIGMYFDTTQRNVVMREINARVHEIVNSTMYLTHDRYKFRESSMTIEIPDLYVFESFSVPIIKARKDQQPRFSTNSKRVKENLRKVMRSLQIGKSIMLEGSPGVGKSSLVEYIAYQTGHKLLKINLSEQTDLMDLLGCDVPKGQDQNFSQDSKLEFAWADGLLLKALKKGYWIILNELNLANQTVLEGLNACLDHRGAVFIPELNKEFVRHPNFRIFATQNPIQKGGGRKSLPSSFLNRFSKVYIEEYAEDDFYSIVESLYSQLPVELLQNLVKYNSTVKQEVSRLTPEESWEFNLRDILRVCDMISQGLYLQESIELIYLKRLKKVKALEACIQAYEKIFQTKFSHTEYFDIPLFVSTRDELEVKYLVNSGERKSVKCSKKLQAQPKSNQNLLRAQMELNFSKYYTKDILKVLSFRWPLLVTGPKGSGKSSLIKNLGEFLNKKVVTIHLNASTDSSDLIGNYDQEDIHRRVQEFVQRFDLWLNDVIITYLYQQKNLDCLNLVNTLQSMRFALGEKAGLEGLKAIIEIIQTLERHITNPEAANEITSELGKYSEGAQKYRDVLEDSRKKASWFNWFNSELISAVIKGDWVVLENIGGCNSAILERLNPLLESNSKFYINECSNFDGKNLKVRPHQDFRLFMVTSGGNDKISNALLNRCVEINVSRGAISDLVLRSSGNKTKENGMVVEEAIDTKDAPEDSEQVVTFEQRHQRFWFRAMVGDMYRMMEMQAVFSREIQNLVMTAVLTSYSILSKAAGNMAISFEMNSFAKLMKKYKENLEFNSDLKASFERAYLESFRPLFRQFNGTPEVVLEIVNKIDILNQQLSPLAIKEISYLSQEATGQVELALLERLNPGHRQGAEGSEGEGRIGRSFWKLSGLSLEESIDFNLMRTVELGYKDAVHDNVGLNLIALSALQAKAYSIFESGVQFAGYLMDQTGLNLGQMSAVELNRCFYLFMITRLSSKILELSINIKDKLKPSDTLMLQEILNVASELQGALRENKLTLTQDNEPTVQKIIQVFFFLSQKHSVIMKSFSYAGPIIKEIILKHVQALGSNQVATRSTANPEKDEKSVRLDLIFQRSNLVSLLPKRPEFYLFIQKLLYLAEKDSTKYNRVLGNYQEDLQINQKLNKILNVDEKFTSSFFKLFGNLIYNLNSIPPKKEEAYQRILYKALEGLLPQINESFNGFEAKRAQIYLDIEEEYNRNILKTVPVLLDDYGVQLDLKLNSEKSRFILIHEYLFLQTVENISKILMTQYSLSSNSSTSFKKEYKRIFGSDDLKMNILDSNLSGDFIFYLYHLFEKNEISSEILLEFKSRIYVEQLLWEKRCSDLNINREDLIYFVYRGMEEIEINGTLRSFFLSTHLANDIAWFMKSRIRVRKEHGYGDILFVILWLFKSFWTENRQVVQELKKLLAMANNLNLINSELGQQELKNAHAQFEQKAKEAQSTNDNSVESTIIHQIQQEILEMLKVVVEFACTSAHNISKGVKMTIGWKLWNLFNIFETESSRTFSRRLFKSKLRVDLLKEGQSLLDLKIAGTILNQIEELRFVNEDSSEIQALTKELNRLEQKLVQRKKEYIVRCSDLENPFEIFDDFLSTNIKYINQIHQFFTKATGLTMTPDMVKEVQNVINNWVVISHQGYFLNFKDIMIPMYYACTLINEGCNEMMSHGNKEEAAYLFSSTTIDEQMTAQNKIVDVQHLLESASSVLQISELTELYEKLYDVVKHQASSAKDNEVVLSMIAFSLQVLTKDLKPKDDTDENDPTKKWIKFNERFQEAIIDEYSKEGVEHHKQRELEEIEERFQKKETTETLETLVSFENNIQDVVSHLNSMNEFTKASRLKANLEDLVLKVIRLREPQVSKNKTSKLVNGIMEVLSYSRTQNKDLVQLKGLEMLLYYLSRKNQKLATVHENYNFYSSENPDELCKLYFISQKILDKANLYLKDQMFFSHPILQNMALIIDHFLTRYLNYTPLPKILPFLSHLIQKLEEWNVTVPREYKILEEYDELLKTVLHWRKLERDSWKDMIEESERKFERKDLVYLIQLWNTIVSEGAVFKDFFICLEPFIKTTSMGTYSIRLELLKLIRDVCKITNRQEIVGICCSIIKHFEYFGEHYSKKKDETIKQLQKDIQQYVDLSKWDGKDHTALKYSVDKYHRKLNKILKKYEEFLECPIEKMLMEPVRKNYLTESVNHFLAVYETDFIIPGKKRKPADITKFKAFLLTPTFELPENLRVTYNNLASIVLQSMEVVPEKYYNQLIAGSSHQIKASSTKLKEKAKRKNIKNLKKKNGGQDGAKPEEEEEFEVKNLCDYLKINTEGFLERIRSLREENTERSLKSRAFADYLKFLRDLGVKETDFRTDVEENLVDALNENLEDGLDKMKESGAYGTVLKKLSKMKKYENRIVDYLSIIEKKKDYHPDLGPESIRRAENYCKSLWTYCLRMRKKLTTIFEEFAKFYKAYDSLTYAFSINGQQVVFTLEAGKEFENIHNLAMENVSYLKMMFQTLDACGLQLDEQAFVYLRQLITSLTKIQEFTSTFVKKELSKISSADLDNLPLLAGQIILHVQEIKSILFNEEKIELTSDMIVYHQVELLGLQWAKVVNWANGLLVKKIESASGLKEDNSGLDLEGVTKSLLLFSQNKLKSTQKYINTVGKFVYEEDEKQEGKQNQYRKCTDLIENEIKNIAKDTKILQTFNEKITVGLLNCEMFHSSPNNQSFLSLLNVVKHIVSSQLVEHVRSVKMIEKFCYLTFSIMYNLFHKGFCSPQKDQEGEQGGEGEGEGDFTTGAGTGIGEGQGMENVSKEIKYEEQVLGEKMDEENKQDENEKEYDKEDDGVDMENDFDGKNYNEENKADEDEGENEGPNPNDLDDEMSEVEDELDYKMWHDDEEEKDQNNEEENKEDEKDPLRKEEKLEFHDKNEMDNSAQRAKEEEQPKDKSDKRNVKDYDEFEDKREEDEMKSQGDPVDEEEYKKVEKEPDYPDKKKDDNENMEEEEGKEEDGKELEGDNDEKLSFESEKAPEDQNLPEEEGEVENMEEKMEEEIVPPTDDKVAEEPQREEEPPQDVKGQGEETKEDEEEEKEENDKQFDSNKEKAQDNKVPFSKGPKNQGGAPNQDEDQEQGGDKADKMEEEKKGNDEISKSQQVTELKENMSDLLKKFVQNFEKNETLDLENFIKDLNISGENKPQEDDKSKMPPPMNMQQMEAPNNYEYEIFEPHGEADTSKLMKTNAPSSSMKHEIQRPATNEVNQASNKEGENNETQTVLLEEEDQTNKETEENQQPEQPEASRNRKKKPQEPTEKEVPQQKTDMKDIYEKAQEKLLKSVQDKSLQEEEQNIEESHVENKKRERQETRMEVEEQKYDVAYDQTVSHSEMKENLQQLISEWRSDTLNQEKGFQIWNKFEAANKHQAMALCEELKAVLQPTEIASLKGDYKSGKRLNMKKIIPYIASNYRKDKIWLRRADPSKRKFQIMLSIDDSLSMSAQNVGFIALESLTVLALAMSKLEVGQIAISRIEDGLKLLHPFDTPLTSAEGPYILSQFNFQYQDMMSSDLSLAKYMRSAIDLFKEWKVKEKASQQICFIVSDGRINKNVIRPLMQEAEENGICFIFVILDSKDEKESILNIRSTQTFYENGQLKINIFNYMDDFPFKYYLVVKDISTLPRSLVDILRQYFERNE